MDKWRRYANVMIVCGGAPRVTGILGFTCISMMTILIPTELRPRSLLRVSESLLEENTNGGITTVCTQVTGSKPAESDGCVLGFTCFLQETGRNRVFDESVSSPS